MLGGNLDQMGCLVGLEGVNNRDKMKIYGMCLMTEEKGTTSIFRHQ